jgi:hypothetical protein
VRSHEETTRSQRSCITEATHDHRMPLSATR